MHRLVRTCLTAFAMLLAGLLLAACTITSDKPLIADDEATAPLPDAFTFYPYEAGDSGYTRSTDAPANFVHDGNRYVARDVPDTKGSLEVRFVPIGEESYLLAVTEDPDPGMIYGFARYSDGVLAIALSPDDDTEKAIAKERTGAMPQARTALAALAVSTETGAIDVKSRTALDYLAKMYTDGRLPMDKPAVGFVSVDPDATPPSRLIQNGLQWMRVP